MRPEVFGPDDVMRNSLVSTRLSWYDLWMRIAGLYAERATCKRRKVGAVIVKYQHQISAGYNGSLSGEPHCIDAGCLMENGHCKRTVHAELNALCDAARRGVSVEGSTVYVTVEPCSTCLQALGAAGIVRVIFRDFYVTESPHA